MFEHAGVACRAAETDLWVHHRRGHADLCRGRGQASFGCTNVGASAEQGGAVTKRNRLTQLWGVVAGRGTFRQLARCVTEQGGEPIQRHGLLRLEGRQLGAQGLDLRSGAGNIHFIAAAASEQAGGHLKLALLDRQRVFGDGQLFAGMAGRHIAAHDPGYRTDACRLEQRRTGVGCRTGGFGAAPQLAEQVQLIAHGEAGIGQVHHRQLLFQRQRLAGQLAARQ